MEAIFPFRSDSVILEVWAQQCGTGNLLSVVWRTAGTTYWRFRYENEDCHYPSEINTGEEAAILQEAAKFAAEWGQLASEVKRRLHQKGPYGMDSPMQHRLGPMAVREMFEWLGSTGYFAIVEHRYRQ
jgi:hypothetical protein